MNKKPEKLSYKKLTGFMKKPQIKYLDDLRSSNEKNIKSQSRNQSSERVNTASAYQTKNQFKISKNSAQRTRIKTQADQFVYSKPAAFQKFINQNKRIKQQRIIKTKSGQKNKNFLETKNLNLKKLNLGSYIYDQAKKSSLQKPETPHSGKHYSFRKAHQSHRSGVKKTALEKYVSQSLQNLQIPSKKNVYSASKQSDIKNTLKKKPGELQLSYNDRSNIKGLSRSKQKYQQGKDNNISKNYISQKQTQKNKTFIERDRQRERDRIQQKDESLQKFQIKWQKKKKNAYDLSKQEIQIFGDRFPEGFQKIKLLGRGGFSLVWLGQHKKSKKKFAVKQIITESSHQTHIKQVWFGTYFFQFGGAPKEQFASHPGIKHLVKLYYYFINKKDTWLLYEKCGDSLGNALYELKSQQYNNEKMYRIHYKQFYSCLKNNQNELRKLILDVARSLQLLSQNNIVHSDLKTQNILVKIKTEEQIKQNPTESIISETKLIDYGSSFVFNNLRQFSMATPQYMAPQILNFILYENQFEYIPKLLEYVQKYNNSWVIDVWSLGSVLLQIVSGVPLWMSLKTIVKKRNTQIIKFGLFAIKGRAFDKIIKQQLQVIQNLQHYLYQQNYSGIVLEQDLKILLKKMLSLNPAKRISPTEIIQYLQKSIQNHTK